MSDYQSLPYVRCHGCIKYTPNPLNPDELGGNCDDPNAYKKRIEGGGWHEPALIPHAMRPCDCKQVAA